MKLIQKFRAKTPKKNKIIGRIATAVGMVAGTILTAGVVTAPVGITILTVLSAVSTGVAVINGAKVEEHEN